jgi:ATP-dependent RNA helicase RhlE
VNKEHPAEFGSFQFSPSIRKDIAQAGYVTPTPIQAACIGPAMEGKDLIGLAQTGTGKTAAFALPIIHRLAQRLELGALVLAPTRELAAQITGMFNDLGKSSGIRVATIVGGVPMDHDIRALTSWPNVMVATPGRLIDHIENRDLSLREIEVLVVDEADRMHDMGFIPQIQRILAELPRQRQTMMFTATMDAQIEAIARQSMRDPLRIVIGQRSAPADRARQQLFQVGDADKLPLLERLVRASNGGRVLVFVRTKIGVDRLARELSGRGLRSLRLHGDREQEDRDRAMADFRNGRCRLLIATDIAARGIDVADIEHVINYDFPRHPEDYVHRIGRTARVDSAGLASSFVTRLDRHYLADVRRLIGDKLPAPILPDGSLAPAEAPRESAAGETSHGKRPSHGHKGRRGFGPSRNGRNTRAATSGGHGLHAAGQGQTHAKPPEHHPRPQPGQAG